MIPVAGFRFLSHGYGDLTPLRAGVGVSDGTPGIWGMDTTT